MENRFLVLRSQFWKIMVVWICYLDWICSSNIRFSSSLLQSQCQYSYEMYITDIDIGVQCVLDLRERMLRIGDEAAPFLSEKDIPKSELFDAEYAEQQRSPVPSVPQVSQSPSPFPSIGAQQPSSTSVPVTSGARGPAPTPNAPPGNGNYQSFFFGHISREQ